MHKTDSKEKWKQNMEQAIGRVRRPGQTKIVHVHYIIAEGTEDVTVYEDCTSEYLVRRGEVMSVSVKRTYDECLGTPDEDERSVRRKVN